MALLRGLLYIGFVVAVIVAWYRNKRKESRAEHHTTEPEINLDSPEAVAAALDSPRWRVRLKAVEALRVENAPQNLSHLLGMLDDPVLDVRDAAASGIAAYPNEAIPELARVLESGKLNARETAVRALCAIGTDDVVVLLIKVLEDDESAWVRIPAAQGLGAIGGEKAIFALQTALDDPHPDVVNAVETALHQHAPVTDPERGAPAHDL